MTPALTVAWPRRRSGNQTLPAPPQAVSASARTFGPDGAPLMQANWLGTPLLPPGGVIPPRPDQYGTSEWRYTPSSQNVMFSFGITWIPVEASHMWALSPGFAEK